MDGPRAVQSTYCTWRGEVGVRRSMDQYVGKNTKLSAQIAYTKDDRGGCAKVFFRIARKVGRHFEWIGEMQFCSSSSPYAL